MKWVESFREQGLICNETGNRFIVTSPYAGPVIICVPFKTYCHSKSCFEKRYSKEEIEENNERFNRK